MPVAPHISPEVPGQLIGDPLRLGQILLNLCNNAVKFTDPGGEVVVSVSMEKESPGNKVMLQFSVKDSGIGISAQEQSKLFLPFSQGDSSNTRKFGGIGMGLAVSKQLAEMMGGKIRVESKPGIGSTFYFTVLLGKQKQTVEYETVKPEIMANNPERVTDAMDKVHDAGVLPVEDNADDILALDRITPLLAELGNYLNENDTKSIEVAEELAPFLRNTQHAKAFEQIMQAIEGYDFEQAENDLQELASTLGIS